MAPESGCKHHLDMAGDVRENKTRLNTVENALEDVRKRADSAVEKAAHADGFAQGSIPDLQKRLENAFAMVEEIVETANVYYGQVREMARDLEKLLAEVEKKADVSDVDKKADAGKTEEGIKSCFLWVRVGFVGITALVLLWVLTILAEKYGLPKPP
jgi:uncharacterized protein YhaN